MLNKFHLDLADLEALAIFLVFFLTAFVSWFWFISKKTGRPMRDLLTLFAAAITVVVLTLTIFALKWKYLGKSGRPGPIEYCLFVAVSLLITWAFNKFARARPKKRSHRQTEPHANEPQ